VDMKYYKVSGKQIEGKISTI